MILRILVLLLFPAISFAQQLSRPKLVVGLVIDQMRWDYLYRYYDRYEEGGFKRLLKEGFSCENTFINYTPTYTGAGHAGIYTGSVPAIHGIMGNSWYSRKLKRNIYCTSDSTVTGVGTTAASGKMSPVNMWASSITDELRLATNFKSKTIAISLKDRGAILPGGHTANAAYWFDNVSGGWISSSFYIKELPEWVKQFNARNLPLQYLSQNWNTLYNISTYTQSISDSNNYESKLGGRSLSFPHITSDLTKNKYEVFRYMPASNTYSFEFAKKAIESEQLGRRGVADFLALSLSQPDYAGHGFAPQSVEMEDTYLRLDRDLAAFLKYLDLAVGKNNYLLFLTADHGAAINPVYAADMGMQAGIFKESIIKKELDSLLENEFKVKGIVERWVNYQVYLNREIISKEKLNRTEIVSFIKERLKKEQGILYVVDLQQLETAQVQRNIKTMLLNGFNETHSGDIQYILKPQWFENWNLGTNHGAWNPYDSHIPLIFMGWNISPGRSYREIYMQDIAPTVAALLKIQMPNGSVGRVIEEVVR